MHLQLYTKLVTAACSRADTLTCHVCMCFSQMGTWWGPKNPTFWRHCFHSLKPTLAPSKKVAPKRTSPYLPNPWFPAQCSKRTEVYIDGACVHNRKGKPEGGVGVCFVSNHPWNISRPAQGRQTNNSAEIQVAIAAAKKATENGVAKLSIFTDSKFLIDSCTKWIHTWKTNGWKTADGKPVVNCQEHWLL